MCSVSLSQPDAGAGIPMEREMSNAVRLPGGAGADDVDEDTPIDPVEEQAIDIILASAPTAR